LGPGEAENLLVWRDCEVARRVLVRHKEEKRLGRDILPGKEPVVDRLARRHLCPAVHSDGDHSFLDKLGGSFAEGTVQRIGGSNALHQVGKSAKEETLKLRRFVCKNKHRRRRQNQGIKTQTQTQTQEKEIVFVKKVNSHQENEQACRCLRNITY
jgi:hypothetical protein